MKLKFKKQEYQTEAVNAVVDCFKGQPSSSGVKYRVDPGREGVATLLSSLEVAGFKNEDVRLTSSQLLENIQAVQRHQNLPISSVVVGDTRTGCPINLDVEMETGTGKTYCYIKSMFELNRQYGWSKFIVVVPSIAIREGVHKSFEITADHFLEDYGKRVRFFIYNSKQLHNLESFSSDAGINVMIINVQAFNARGQDARRIYEELDDFQSRKPIDVIKSNRPILILDEPQKMGGDATMGSLSEFNPLMILRYSATHKKEYNKIHRLDALDAYNQKLVKKIAVRGISVRGLTGTNAYLYLEGIQISADKPPVASVEFEIKQGNGIKRITRKLNKRDNLFDLSQGLDQYKGFVVSEIDARTNTVSFNNGDEISAGEVVNDQNEEVLRRIQIREAIKSHFEKERMLFHQGIKVLSLFFIDTVAKYRRYDENGESSGEYAQIFEEEYKNLLSENRLLIDDPYTKYLDGIQPERTHNGYFSIDKKSKRLVDPTVAARGETAGQTDDVDAYDLILKDKERLLSFDEPVRFIFSHSALREGWDNPNVFVICTLKHSDNTISRRQEVGRGMRISVNQAGDRMDNPATVHDINLLTVVTSESYTDFVTALQRDISESLSSRPRIANREYFKNKVLTTPEGDITVTPEMAGHMEFYLIQNGYVDVDQHITEKYHNDKKDETLAPLPAMLTAHGEQVFALIDTVFSDAQMPGIEDGRKTQVNPLNANFDKKEFKELWSRINQKAAYTVHFESSELVGKCIAALNSELRVTPLQYTVQRGQQTETASYDEIQQGDAFTLDETATESVAASIQSSVKYDLIGKVAEGTQLTRKTVAAILGGVNNAVFQQYKTNPEDFISKASTFINEQKATMIVEHLAYDPVAEKYDTDIFTQDKAKQNFSQAGDKLKRHVYDYVFTDSKIERAFVTDLDTSEEVVVYAKLPKGFSIPTPVGDYNPDWAISFKEGLVKHVYFVAETKGSLSSMDLRKIEKSKIECARKFFAKITSDQVKYDVVDSYGKLMELVK
ncbi:MAG TPA: DEAD/DEAH box helicase family protein [Pyrinomonadaceae bacterium]|nr:DEAD/DEAH box helicase family protein [Pyrinomonadaceae bacterium]HRK49441.1 DEAD/DEAH box helicase family protein [Pyrinomonadaceae bacterium]